MYCISIWQYLIMKHWLPFNSMQASSVLKKKVISCFLGNIFNILSACMTVCIYICTYVLRATAWLQTTHTPSLELGLCMYGCWKSNLDRLQTPKPQWVTQNCINKFYKENVFKCLVFHIICFSRLEYKEFHLW